MSNFINPGKVRVLIRGAGDIATGVGHRFFRSGFKVFMTEIPRPTCIRRGAAFSEAVYEGKTEVEGITAAHAKDPLEAEEISTKGFIPVLVDIPGKSVEIIRPIVVVDAVLAKKNLGTSRYMAPIVIGVGPGFSAGVDCHAVVETMRGHHLGRVITSGSAEENTGVPGEIKGYSLERVIYAPVSGRVEIFCDIGDRVASGQIIAKIGGTDIISPIGGVLRGIIRNGFEVDRGMKIGDVDPRGIMEYCFTISDKARAVAGGVLEAVLHMMSKTKL